MKKEKHIVNKTYSNHQLSRFVDVYEVSANGCHSIPESGYKGTEATLVDDPAWNEKFSSYSITGATLTGNNFIINNDVTAQANYETAKNVTTIKCSSTKNSGFIGDTASLSDPSAEWNEKFSSYSITGSTLTGNNFRFTGSDITAQANFETAKNVTLQTDGNGTISASPISGFSGTIVTLSNTPNANYGFSGYSITGATLTGNQFTLNNDVTARAGFSAEPIKTKLLGYIGNNFPMPKVEYRWSTYTSTININCCFDLSGNLRNGLYTDLYFLPVTWDNVRTPQTLYNHRTDYHSYTADYDPTFGTEGVNRYSIKGDVVVTSFLLSGTQAGGVNAQNTGMIIQAKGGDLTFPITHEGAGGFIVSAENPNGVFTAASGKVGIVITASNVSQYYPTARFFTDQTGYSNNASFGGYVIL